MVSNVIPDPAENLGVLQCTDKNLDLCCREGNEIYKIIMNK